MASSDRRTERGELAPRWSVLAQLLFTSLEHDAVRCDLVTLDEGCWGRQTLPRGTPISVCFLIRSQVEQVAFASMTSAWAASMAEVHMAFLDDDGHHFVVLAAEDSRVMLGVPPFR